MFSVTLLHYTTSGNTSLDFILTNMYNFYIPPSALPSLGEIYHLSILLSSSSNFKHSFSISYGTYRLLQNSGHLSFGMWLNTEDCSNIYKLKFLGEKLDEANKLRKSIKREIRKLAQLYYKIRLENCSLINQKIGILRLKSCVAGGLSSLTSTYPSPLMLLPII